MPHAHAARQDQDQPEDGGTGRSVVPAYVKAAVAGDPGALRGGPAVPRHAFADGPGRQYPVHTKAATWLSAASYLTKVAAGEQIAPDAAALGRALRAAADYWGIAGDLRALTEATKAAAAPPAAGDYTDDDFAALVPGPDGTVERHLPLRNPAEIKQAAAWLDRYRGAFLYADRRAIAGRILAKAAAAAVDLGEHRVVLDRIAGRGTCALKSAGALLEDRARRLTGRHNKLAADCRQAARSLADPARPARPGPALWAKLAAAVDRADRLTGLDARYGQDLAYPEDVLFAVTAKTAAEAAARHVRLADGAVYRTGDLAGLSLTAVQDAMGDDVAGPGGLMVDGTKLAAALARLDRRGARKFAAVAAAAGIAPAARTAGAPQPRLNLRDLATPVPPPA